MIEYWYRYSDIATAPPLDEWDNPVGPSGVIIHLNAFKVLKHTPKGVQLDIGWEDTRLVLHSATRRFACPTIEEAKISFLARKERQLGIYLARAKHVRRVIEKADRLLDQLERAEMLKR